MSNITTISPIILDTRTEDDPFIKTVKSAVILFFIVLGIVLNSILVFAVCRENKFHRPTFFFLLNLSFADLVRSALCLPFYLLALINTNDLSTENQFCKSASFFYSLLAYETIFTLLSLSLARYSMIAHYNFHRKKLTKFVCATVIAMTWTLAVIMAIPPIFRASMPNGAYRVDLTEQSNGAEIVQPAKDSADFVSSETSYVNRAGMRLGPVCCLGGRYYSPTDTFGFIIVFTIVLLGIHLVYFRIFLFMRQHRKMNPARRAPAISDNWTFFGPGAVPVMSSSVSAHFQSAIVQGVPGGAVATRAPAALSESPNAIDNYHMEEKITKTTYFLTATITFLWCPYILANYVAVFTDRETTESVMFLATSLTFFQSAVTPLTCIVMMPPVIDMACDVFKTLKCKKRSKASRSTSTSRVYENIADLNCSSSV